MGKDTLLVALFVGSVLTVAGPAFGQAWTPEANSGSAILSFQHVEGRDHIFSVDITGVMFGDDYVARGRRAFLGEIEAYSLTLQVDYGVTDRLALSAALPYIASQYTGTVPHGAAIDDGSFHSGFQDLSVELRYKTVDGPVVITPFVSYVTPTNDYPTLGHASIGRNLQETSLGAYFGTVFYSTYTYIHARYSYTFVERVLGVSTDRSNVALAIGHQLLPRLGVRLFGTHLDTRGGLDWWTDVLAHDSHGEVVFHHHDQLSRTESTRGGLGLTYSVSEWFDLDFSVAKTVDGKNTHEATASTVSLVWNF